MADNVVDLQIKVNTETGQIDVLGQKLEALGKQGQSAGQSFVGLTGEAASLAQSLLGLTSVAAVLSFFASAVSEAERSAEGFRQLKFAIESTGHSWEANAENVKAWTKAIQDNTRFSDDQAVTAMSRLARVTGDVGSAQKATQVAMGISVATGKDLGESTDLITGLLSGQERALQLVRREFGAQLGPVKDNQEALDKLSQLYAHTAEKEDNLTKDTALAAHAFDDFKKQVGETFGPIWDKAIRGVTFLIKGIDDLGAIVAEVGAKIVTQATFAAQALAAIATGHFGQLKGIRADYEATMAGINDESVAQFAKAEQRKTLATRDALVQDARLRAAVTQQALEAQRESHVKAIQLEAEMQRQIQALGVQTFNKKVAQLNAEITAKRAAIEHEKMLEADRVAVEEQLERYRVAKMAELQREEINTKVDSSFQIANLAIQTFQIANQLGDKGSEAEKTRAIALLALQQAIAIGWAWVHAMRIGGPFAAPIAAAETALLVAQFAQQVQAVEQSHESERANLSQVNTITPVIPPPGGAGFPGGGGGGGGGPGGTFVVQGGGGGGGGGGVSINTVVINLQLENFDARTADNILNALAQQLRNRTGAAIRFALASETAAGANSAANS